MSIPKYNYGVLVFIFKLYSCTIYLYFFVTTRREYKCLKEKELPYGEKRKS